MLKAALLLVCLLTILILYVLGRIYFRIQNSVNMGTISVMLVTSLLIGVFIYAYINVSTESNLSLAVIHTVVDLIKMYIGMDRIDEFEALVKSDLGMIILFWFGHIIAYSTTISFVVSIFGNNIVQLINSMRLGMHPIELIYGFNDNTLRIGEHLLADNKASVVFISGWIPQIESITAEGLLVFSDEEALNADYGLLKKLGIRKPFIRILLWARTHLSRSKDHRLKIRLLAISDNADANLSYAVKFRNLLNEKKIDYVETELILFGLEEYSGSFLQKKSDVDYAYDTVRVYDNAELASRILVREFPVCNVIDFNDSCLATEDVEAVIVGFGHVGQEVLRKLVANGQFEGSRFHTVVFVPDVNTRDRFFDIKYPAITGDNCFDKYQVEFKNEAELAEYIDSHSDELKYIVIAVDDEIRGNELAESVSDVFTEKISLKKVVICQCYKDKIIVRRDPCLDNSGNKNTHISIYDADILFGRDIDSIAKLLNYEYSGDKYKSADSAWADCSYFNRMSSRAAGDYLSCLLTRLRDKKLIPDDRDIENQAILDNLAKSEHLRWCAFHYAYGYNVMPHEEHYRNTQRVIWEKVKDSPDYDENTILSGLGLKSTAELDDPDKSDCPPGGSPQKNSVIRKHACLVKWDDLPAVSQTENELYAKFEREYGDTTKAYEKSDYDNVEIIQKLLSAKEEKVTDAKKRGSFARWLILPIIAVAGVAIALGVYRNYDMNRPMGYSPMPELDIAVVDDSISYQTARSRLGDSESARYTPTTEKPASCYPLSYKDSDALIAYLKSNYPPTRDQGEYGTCWAHAVLSVAELNMIRNNLAGPDIDFSELHLIYYIYHPHNPVMGDTGDNIDIQNSKEILNAGGNALMGQLTLARRRGCASESVMPYNTARRLFSVGSDIDTEYEDEAYLKNSFFINIHENPDQVKQVISEMGAVDAAINFGSSTRDRYLNSSKDAFYVPTYMVATHEVAIVGWDDDYPAENFKTQPAHNGAWLVRNSFGLLTRMSYKSYFWLSYDDASLDDIVTAFEFEPISNETEKMYCYDSNFVVPMIFDIPLDRAANVFTVLGKSGSSKEKLSAVNFYVCGDIDPVNGADYTIRILTDPGDNTDPVGSGKQVVSATTTGTVYFAGYYTIDLKNPVEMNNRDKYVVEIELSSGSLAVEGDADMAGVAGFNSAINPGESYVYSEDSWIDFKDSHLAGCGNVMIGAITRDVK